MMSSRQFFEHLDGQLFLNQKQLEDKIREAYIECLPELPPDVTLVRLMAKAKSREWIIRGEDDTYRIIVGRNGYVANEHVPDHGTASVVARLGS